MTNPRDPPISPNKTKESAESVGGYASDPDMPEDWRDGDLSTYLTINNTTYTTVAGVWEDWDYNWWDGYRVYGDGVNSNHSTSVTAYFVNGGSQSYSIGGGEGWTEDVFEKRKRVDYFEFYHSSGYDGSMKVFDIEPYREPVTPHIHDMP